MTCNSSNTLLSQASSAQTRLMDLYSASAEESDTVSCFLDFHDIGLPPNKIKNPLNGLLVIGQAAQSLSQ